MYLLSPADGTVAAQAIALMDALINRQRRKVARWEDHSRVGLYLDEIIMYGSHEREPMESVAFWAGKATRSSQSYNHNSDDKTTQRSFAGALEPEELLPRNTGEARLVPRGTPGQMVELMDWGEFVCYLNELRQARYSCRFSSEMSGFSSS